ncbi:hypothetical protein JCM3774_006130 [Rhodotorula dairenensis]
MNTVSAPTSRDQGDAARAQAERQGHGIAALKSDEPVDAGLGVSPDRDRSGALEEAGEQHHGHHSPSVGAESTTRSPSARTKTSSPHVEAWTAGSVSSATLPSHVESAPPPPPVRPPKSAARRTPRSSSSPTRSSPAESSVGYAAVEPQQPLASLNSVSGLTEAAVHVGSPTVADSSATTTTTTTPTLGVGLLYSRPRPQLATATMTTDPTARISTASSSAGSSPYPSRRSGVFYMTDESDWTGGGLSSSALETPATTVDLGASPSSSPAANGTRSRANDDDSKPALDGLGLDFLATRRSSAVDSSARTSFDDDLERGIERITEFAQTLPSPTPTVPAPLPFRAVPSSTTTSSSVSSSRRQSQTGYAAVPHAPHLPLGLGRPPAKTDPTYSPSSEGRIELPRVADMSSGTTPLDSHERIVVSPAPSFSGRLAAFESETDFFSTDAQTDADDYDEGEDSFSLYPHNHDGPRRRRERSASSSLEPPPPSSSMRIQRAPPQIDFESFAAAINGGGLWNEDVPIWEGALPRPGDGVVDWTGCRLQRQALPSNTTHLILAQCQTPLQIAPLLTSSMPSLAQTLVVLDIGSCGLTEIPSAIGACCFLEELDIHGNPLATGVLPTFLGTLPALNVLLADECNIRSLPDSLAQLTRLHTLTLRNNHLRTLPAWISRLTALEQLLIDGNPFHWQIHNLVRPLLEHAPPPPPPAENVPMPRLHAHSVLAPPPGPIRTESSPVIPLAVGIHEAPSVVSPPLASPTMFRSAAGTPVPEEPQLETPTRPRAGTFGDGSAPPLLPMPQYDDSPAADPKDKRKWGRLLKKVSTGRLRSASSAAAKRSAAAEAAGTHRVVSQPVTRDEESDAEQGMVARTFRNPSRSRNKSRPRATKRQSFLALKAFGGVEPPRAPSASQPAALEAVLSYLRDLDDLSPDLSLPTIPLDASSPALRHSPSLGALSPGGSYPRSPSPGSLRRVQSSRRVPSSTSSSAHRGSHASSFTDDAPDATSAGDGATSAATQKRPDDPAKRAAVIDEIVATEKSYLRGLQELCSIYVASAAATTTASTTGKRDTVVPATERRAVFGNVEAIRDFHAKILLPDLLAAAESSPDLRVVADNIGEVFSSHVSFMKIYSSYINGFDDALARIQSWAKPTPSRSPLLPSPASPLIGGLASYDAAAGIQSTLSASQKKRIKSWLKRCRSHASHSQISLESYLLLPIQRIPRYRMLLGTLASCTSVDGSGSALTQAVRDLEEIALMLNESKRENEGRAQLVAWQNRLVSKFKSPLVQPHRTLLKSGALTLVRSVKRTTMQLEPPLPGVGGEPEEEDPAGEEVFTLYTEAKEMSLTGLLCNDLLVLVKMPSPPLDADPTAPVDLYTVLRLTSGRSALQGGHHRAKPPASVDGPDDLLRLKIGDKAVCYFRCAADPYKNRKEAHAWANAINLQWEVNT